MELVLLLGSLPVLAVATYLFVLVLLSRRLPPPPPPADPPRLRFAMVVPAHNEEAGIADTVASLLAVEYPAELRRVVVVADNCVDATAERARAAGAAVMERQNATLRGKGYALAFAFEALIEEGNVDAVVVVDADSVVSPNLLAAFALRFAAGAQAVQAEYGVRNPEASWRTRLMVIALSIFHNLRSLARERMGVSCGLRGNGMGFTTSILASIPHEAFSIVEDVEYGIRLGRAGHRVWYVPESHVLGEMVSSAKASQSQRERWEGGRLRMAQLYGFPLLGEALRKRSLMLFDLAADLVVPPLSYVVLAATVGTVAAAALAIEGGGPGALYPWGLASFMVVAYVVRGVLLSDRGLRGFVDLAFAPVYVGWKLLLVVTGAGRKTAAKGQWVRTAREGEGGASPPRG